MKIEAKKEIKAIKNTIIIDQIKIIETTKVIDTTEVIGLTEMMQTLRKKIMIIKETTKMSMIIKIKQVNLCGMLTNSKRKLTLLKKIRIVVAYSSKYKNKTLRTTNKFSIDLNIL